MKKVLITGNQGQLGRALEKLCRRRKIAFAGVDIDRMDISDAKAVDDWVGASDSDTLINCAAFTAVDLCESREEEARRVNAEAVGYLADSCARHHLRLVHVSTDYVFDGGAEQPYREDEQVGPISAYGRTKLEGERAAARIRDHLIVRTAWLYGLGGKNFVEAICRQVDSGAEKLRVVSDQVGSPTFCDDLAAALLDLAAVPEARGIYHGVNSGRISWFGFAREILRLLGSQIPVEAVGTDEFPRPAPRPAWSVLDNSKLEAALSRPMPSWQDGLRRYMEARCAD